jgi:hypothetical protein
MQKEGSLFVSYKYFRRTAVVMCKASSVAYPGESNFHVIRKVKLFSSYIKTTRLGL